MPAPAGSALGLPARRACRTRPAIMSPSLPAGPRRRWASPSAPKSETTIPHGVPCTRLANPIQDKAQQIAAHVHMGRAAHVRLVGKLQAWQTYRLLQKQYAALIGDREPIVLHGRLPGMGAAPRTVTGGVTTARRWMCSATIDRRRRRLRGDPQPDGAHQGQCRRTKRWRADAFRAAHRQPDFLKNSAKLFVAVVEGDFLTSAIVPARHEPHPLPFFTTGSAFGRPRGSHNARDSIAASRRWWVQLSSNMYLAPNQHCALMGLRGGNAGAAIADDGGSACDRLGGEQAEPDRRGRRERGVRACVSIRA